MTLSYAPLAAASAGLLVVAVLAGFDLATVIGAGFLFLGCCVLLAGDTRRQP